MTEEQQMPQDMGMYMPEQMPMPYSAPQQNSGHSDLVKLSLNNLDILDEIRIKLLGLEFDNETEKYVKSKYLIQLVSDAGVAGIMTQLSGIINRNTTLSNLTEEEIRSIAEESENIINDLLHDNYFEWGVTKENWAMIRSLVGNSIRFTLNRAKNGGEMNILGNNTKTMIQKQQIEGTQRMISQEKSKWSLFK